MPSPAAAPLPRRADALRNRERVIAAAAVVFAEKGLDAGVPEIAARAGVGKATVYRSFPSKEHLVAAVACERLAWITELATRALEAPDAGQAFERTVLAIAEQQAGDSAVAGSPAADTRRPAAPPPPAAARPRPRGDAGRPGGAGRPRARRGRAARRRDGRGAAGAV